ncbi:hypothetical protein [Mesorhizobium sp. ORM16]|uniref:hypothetical protein n=1 Tax=Mesorhizobium sp. ORM16 TaxID=3376989 RepID=UPI003857766D
MILQQDVEAFHLLARRDDVGGETGNGRHPRAGSKTSRRHHEGEQSLSGRLGCGSNSR